MTADAVARTIGTMDEDFAGGMSCEVFGGDIALQVLTRGGRALTNTTYVSGRWQGRVREVINAADAVAGAARSAANAAMAAACATLLDGDAGIARGCPWGSPARPVGPPRGRDGEGTAGGLERRLCASWDPERLRSL